MLKCVVEHRDVGSVAAAACATAATRSAPTMTGIVRIERAMHERLVVAVAAQHDRRVAPRAPTSPRAIHAAIGVLPVPPTVRLPTLTAGIGVSRARQPAGVVQHVARADDAAEQPLRRSQSACEAPTRARRLPYHTRSTSPRIIHWRARSALVHRLGARCPTSAAASRASAASTYVGSLYAMSMRANGCGITNRVPALESPRATT